MLAAALQQVTRLEAHDTVCQLDLWRSDPVTCPIAGSKKAKEILDSWGTSLGKFKQLVPPSEAGTPEASPEAEASAGNGAGPQEAKSAVPVASAA